MEEEIVSDRWQDLAVETSVNKIITALKREEWWNIKWTSGESKGVTS